MTSPRLHQRWQPAEERLDRYTLLVAAAACWMLLLLIGLVLTFS
jgi:hypothetical protein